MTAPHDAPSAAQLLEAVRQFLEQDVLAATQGRVQFHTRVAINVLGIVERELLEGHDQALGHRDGLASLGLESDAELARAIRGGDLDERMAEVAAFVRACVREKLVVANPGYLEQPSSGR